MSDITQTDFVTQHADLSTSIYLLDKWISLQHHERLLPGLAVGLVRDGQLIWGKGYGFADVERETPITLDTRFRIASITKTFTAVAILQLRDRGKLRLDNPVSTYLNWFNLRYDDAPPITIRHLLTHTSGLPRDATVPHWTENVFQSWDEVVTTTQQRKPVIPPLQDFGYSNLGYTLLGGIIEVVTGETWVDYIQKNILNPLDMNDTVVAPIEGDSRLAVGFLMQGADHARRATRFVPTNGFSPSASMSSSVNDLVKYARFHLSTQSDSILSRHSLREMHTVHWLNKDWQGGYGLGSGIFRINNWTISGHAGGYIGYLTYFTVCREHNFGVIFLTNSVDSDPFQFVERAYKMVLPEVVKISTPETPEAPSEWQNFVGCYYADGGEVEVFILANKLQIMSLRYVNALPTVLEPTNNPNEFTIKEFGNPQETARFELDDKGRVTRLWLRSEYVLPRHNR